MKLGTILAFLYCWFSPLFCAVDVYVFNVGQGNCIWVSMDVVSGENTGKKKVLIVDCGLRDGKGWMNNKTFTANLKDIGLCENVYSYALWITHLHADHFSLLWQNIPSSRRSILAEVGYVFVGVGGGWANESFDYWPTSCLPDYARNAKRAIEKGSADVQEKWEEYQFRKSNMVESPYGQICAYIKRKKDGNACFPIKVWDYTPEEKQNLQGALNNFTAETDCNLRPLLPDPEKRYNDGNEPTNPNGQSLALALEYAGGRVIFPGDAPGDLFLALSVEDQGHVSRADVLIAPHHGSVNNKEDLWETYDVNSGIRKRYCTIVSSIPVAKDLIPNKEFMSGRPSRAAFVAAEPHLILVYDQVRNRNRYWRTSQTKFSMDENVCYYRCHIGGDLQLRANERVIGIGSREKIPEIDRWESDWED
ncbi:MAG: hypothetical protein LBR92_03905 [Puniceicoccales bacterium]|jgi:hypothetical protein|nr:hypothetical protein [Puniceicoccales bacterium]